MLNYKQSIAHKQYNHFVKVVNFLQNDLIKIKADYHAALQYEHYLIKNNFSTKYIESQLYYLSIKRDSIRELYNTFNQIIKTYKDNIKLYNHEYNRSKRE